MFSETLRLYSVGDSVSKTVEKTTVVGGYTFPAGSEIHVRCVQIKLTAILYYLLHFKQISSANISRLPQYYDDPDAFNPDRFHPDNKK